MEAFIKIQYKLYIAGANSIGIEKIEKLASKYLPISEYDKMFNTKD